MTNSRRPPSPKSPGRAAQASSSGKPRRPFYHHFLVALGFCSGVIGCALVLGILGYHTIAGFSWVDSLLNASMILSGMGPVGDLKSDAAKVFASAYALFSGLVFIGATGILLTPVFHRVLHKFHIEERDL